MFGLCGILTLAKEMNPGGEQVSGGKCLSPRVCELVCLLRTGFHLSPPHACTQGFICSGAPVTSLRLFMVSPVISQNHRMFGVGRDLCGSSSPNPCRSRVTQSRLHRTLSRRVLNISRAGISCRKRLVSSQRQG